MTARAIASRFLLLAALAAAGHAAGWTDRGEYDLVMAIRSEASAPKRVELLDQWKQKYPQTELRQVRLELYLAAYQTLGNSARMLQTAMEMLAAQANNWVGVYWCTLLAPEVADPSPDVLAAGEKSARQLLAGLDAYFAPAAKPAAMDQAGWQKGKDSAELLAHRALGWVLWQRGDYAGAAAEFRVYLEKNPKSAEISAWMGMVSGLQKEPDKQVAGLWLLQRAATLRGEFALGDDQRRQMGVLADQLYSAYHGDSDGLENLKTAVAAAAFPPQGFHIETAAAIATRRADEELARTNPDLAAWVRIRRQLEAPDGEKYFAETLRTSPLPKLKGIVVRVLPTAKPYEVVLAMEQPPAENVVLDVSEPFPNVAAPGTELEFEGTAQSFSKQPFMLTVQVDRERIAGWPDSPARGSRRQK